MTITIILVRVIIYLDKLDSELKQEQTATTSPQEGIKVDMHDSNRITSAAFPLIIFLLTNSVRKQ